MTATTVTVVGPDAYGRFTVHRLGCADATRHLESGAAHWSGSITSPDDVRRIDHHHPDANHVEVHDACLAGVLVPPEFDSADR